MNNNDTTTSKPRFTAALIDNETKSAIIELRNETKLSEKALMRVILGVVTAQREQVLAIANEVKARNDAERQERKAQAYQALKTKLAASRKAKKAPKASKKADAEVQNAA